MKIFHCKTIQEVKNDANSSNGLKKSLTSFNLIIIGLSAIIGTGIFVLVGSASQHSGPALPVSMLLCGFVSIIVALIYTEVASMIPSSGSVYSYAYVSLGELAAWLVGMLLVLEFTFNAAAVAAGWSAYATSILKNIINLPDKYLSSSQNGGIIDVPAIIFTLTITFISIRGNKENILINAILVFVKISVMILFIALALPNFEIKNMQPFAPNGLSGIVAGSASLFLAFAGFDTLAASAEECKNPKKDLIIGIIGSILICTFIYMLIGVSLVGMVPFTELNNPRPLAYALSMKSINIGSIIVTIGAITGMTTVIMVYIYVQPRILMVMARDGLLPSFFSKLHHKYSTPYIGTIFTGILIAIFAGFTPINILCDISNLSILLMFSIAIIIVIVLRVKFPDAERPFKCPLLYLLSPIAIISCLYLASSLISGAGYYILIWMVLSLSIYLFTYRCQLKE